jgi:hypothetical protein
MIRIRPSESIYQARVFSCLLTPGHQVSHTLADGQAACLYVLEGGPVALKGKPLPALAAAMVTGESPFEVVAAGKAELLLVDVRLL